MVEATDMEFGQGPQDQDIDLMPKASEVTPQSPPPPISEPVPSEQGEVFLLNDDLMMDVFNMLFDELSQRIVQAQRKHFSNDHVSPAFMKERVIMPDVRKHPVAMVDATMAYGRATSSNVKFLLAENEQIAKNLQAARQKAKQSVRSAMAEMMKAILVKH